MWMGDKQFQERRCWTENTNNIHQKYSLVSGMPIMKQRAMVGALRERINLYTSEEVSNVCFICD